MVSMGRMMRKRLVLLHVRVTWIEKNRNFDCLDQSREMEGRCLGQRDPLFWAWYEYPPGMSFSSSDTGGFVQKTRSRGVSRICRMLKGDLLQIVTSTGKISEVWLQRSRHRLEQ